MKLWLQRILAIALTGLVTSCGLGRAIQDGSCASGNQSRGIKAFGDTLLGAFQQVHCSNCHVGNGLYPFAFANPDPAIGYTDAKNLSNFSSPDKSRFVVKTRDLKHNCGTAAQCADVGAQLQSAIAQWAQAEKQFTGSTCSSLGNIHLAAQPVSATDLAAGNITLRWNIADLDPAFAGIAFEVKAKLQTAPSPTQPGAYLLSDPRLATASKQLRISDIELTINGAKHSELANFSLIDFVVAPASFSFSDTKWPFPSLTSASQMVVFSASGTDQLEIDFSLSETTEMASVPEQTIVCKAPEAFAPVDSLFKTRLRGGSTACFSCHGGANAMAASRFPMIPGTDVCTEALMRVVDNDTIPTAAQTYLVKKPNNNGYSHPDIGGNLNNTEIGVIEAWLAAERAAP